MPPHRNLLLAACSLLVACSVAPSPAVPAAVPVELQGADAEAIVACCVVTRAADGAESGCWHAPTVELQRELLRRLRCSEVEVRGPAADLALVAVVEPGAPRLQRVTIGSEEGVDVLTLELGRAPLLAESATRSAVLLWVERRPHQLAVVRRDLAADTERTVGIFDGR